MQATIQDISAVAGDPATDEYAGDIRNAKVTFVNRANNSSLLCKADLALPNPSDTKTATASCKASLSPGSGGGTDYTVGIKVEGYYTRNAGSDNTIITVSTAQDKLTTGGGFLLLSSSEGPIAGDRGQKNSFGFNVKHGENGSSPQGDVNIIVRSNGHVYQAKSTTIKSISIVGKVAQIEAINGSIQEITNPALPVSVAGNVTIRLTMTDNGEPGANDTVGISVWDSSTSVSWLWFSSNWIGSQTLEQRLDVGNLVVQ